MPPKATPKKAAAKGTSKAPAKGNKSASSKPATTAAAAAAAAIVTAPAAVQPAAPEPIKIKTCALKEIVSVIMTDADGSRKDSGKKTTLVIDETCRINTFLKYQNVNFIEAVSPDQMDIEKLRYSILCAIRYGKPAVIDLADATDMDRVLEDRLNAISPGLYDMIIDGSIIENENFLKMIKPSDSNELQDKYQYGLAENFHIVFLTKLPAFNESLMRKTFVVQVE